MYKTVFFKTSKLGFPNIAHDSSSSYDRCTENEFLLNVGKEDKEKSRLITLHATTAPQTKTQTQVQHKNPVNNWLCGSECEYAFRLCSIWLASSEMFKLKTNDNDLPLKKYYSNFIQFMFERSNPHKRSLNKRKKNDSSHLIVSKT